MDCGSYIEKYLSAQVDGELSAAELRAAEEHLAGCADCRARLAEERAVKALLRERAERHMTPPMVRGSILAALDAIDAKAAPEAAERGHYRFAGAGRARPTGIRRARVWMPIAVAAAAVFAFVMMHGGLTPAHAFAPFDIATDRYAHFVEHFEPNLKSNQPGDISEAYLKHQLPGFVWNFQPSGYKLIGARLDHLRDGSPVSYTFYRGDAGMILCTYMKSHWPQPPAGEMDEVGGHHFFRYKGYSICLSHPPGGFICVLVSQRPIKEFEQEIVLSAP